MKVKNSTIILLISVFCASSFLAISPSYATLLPNPAASITSKSLQHRSSKRTIHQLSQAPAFCLECVAG